MLRIISLACIAHLSSAQQSDQTLSVVSWNVHFQCGAFHGCREKAAARLAELAHDASADVAIAIELDGENASAPLDLTSYFRGWTQVAGPCPALPGHYGDALALMLAPQHVVIAQGGGCLDAGRAFAVAHVKPPSAIGGCESLCVVAVHTPHANITQGQDTVDRVCGTAARQCAVAAGDWNANINISNWPASRGPLINPVNVSQFWKQLVSESAPLTVQAPEAVTCCYPESKYFGFDDHVITNIETASLAEANVFEYQMKHGGLKGDDTEEHKPIHVKLAFGNPDTSSRIHLV